MHEGDVREVLGQGLIGIEATIWGIQQLHSLVLRHESDDRGGGSTNLIIEKIFWFLRKYGLGKESRAKVQE